MEDAIREAAAAYVASGLSVVPCNVKDKRPIGQWKERQTRRLSAEEVNALDWPAIGVVCGDVSGHLEMIDFDAAAVELKPWRDLVLKHGGEHILDRIYLEKSQRGGGHVMYRCEKPVPGNMKLAANLEGQCTIETRGQGGFVVVAPSPGYERKLGSLASLPVLTADERELLMCAAMSLNRKAPTPAKIAAPNVSRADSGNGNGGDTWQGVSTFDDFQARGMDAVVGLLEGRGWTPAGDGHWTRPGKVTGVSATLFDSGVFHVFSTNAEPFRANAAYNLSQVYATLKHDGDFSAAARALYSQGYGTRQPSRKRSTTPATPTATLSTTLHMDVDEPLPDVPRSAMPAPPTDQELVDLYKDTHFGVFIDAVRAVAPVKPSLAIAAATVLQSALLAPRVMIGNRRPNAYAMLIAQPASGKGLCEGAVLDAMAELGLATIPVSSTKSFVKCLGPNPWGTLLISEFTPFLQSHSWTADVIPILNGAFDAKNVSLNSERTGNASVSGAAPSLMSGCQTMAFLQDGMAVLLHNGFLSRNLMAVDDTVYPELGRLSRTGGGTVDTSMFMPSWRDFMANLPDPVRPSAEETKATGSGANIKERGIGKWVHGRPSANVMVAEYPSLWHRLDFPSQMLPSMRRLVPHYLPLLSMPFMTAQDWRDMRIPKAALERGERALLAFYWHLAKAVDIMPETTADTLTKRMLACVRDHGPLTKRELQRRLNGWKNARDFQDGLDALVTKGMVTVEERKNAGARPSTVYSVPREGAGRLMALPRLPKQEPAVQGTIEESESF